MDAYSASEARFLGRPIPGGFSGGEIHFGQGNGVNAVVSASYAIDTRRWLVPLLKRSGISRRSLQMSTLAVITSMSATVMLIFLCFLSRGKVRNRELRRLSNSEDPFSPSPDGCHSEEKQGAGSFGEGASGYTFKEQSTSRSGGASEGGLQDSSHSGTGTSTKTSTRKRRYSSLAQSSPLEFSFARGAAVGESSTAQGPEGEAKEWIEFLETYLSEAPAPVGSEGSPETLSGSSTDTASEQTEVVRHPSLEHSPRSEYASAEEAGTSVHLTAGGAGPGSTQEAGDLEAQPSTSAAALSASYRVEYSYGLLAEEDPSTSSGGFITLYDPDGKPLTYQVLSRVPHGYAGKAFKGFRALKTGRSKDPPESPLSSMLKLLAKEELTLEETNELSKTAEQMVAHLMAHYGTSLIGQKIEKALPVLMELYEKLHALVCALVVLGVAREGTWWADFVNDLHNDATIPLGDDLEERLLRQLTDAVDILRSGCLPDDPLLSRLLSEYRRKRS